MSTPLRVVAFVSALAAAFALAWGGGRLVGPLDTEPVAHEGAAHGDDASSHDDTEAGSHDDHSADVAGATGLAARAGRLHPRARRPYAGRRAHPPRLPGAHLQRAPLLDYTREHEKDLHLIVVRRDLTGFQHVHPRLDRSTGTWSVDVRSDAGRVARRRRLRARGLGGHHAGRRPSRSPATSRPPPLPADDRIAEVETDAGTYTVTLAGDTAPGASTVLTTRIELDGEPVTDLAALPRRLRPPGRDARR